MCYRKLQAILDHYKDITTIALNLYSGLILLEAFYNTKFYELRKTINKLLNEAKARFIDSRDNVVIQFRDYIESVTYKYFHVISEEDGEQRERIAYNETWGEYDKTTGVYYLNAKGLKEIADELGKNKQLLLKELEKANVLIAKNVTYYTRVTRQTIKVHKIKFSEMIEPKIIGDEEETEEKTNYEELDIPF